MESHELHNLNKAGPSTTPVSPAPGYVGYDPRTTNHATGPSPLLFYDEARVPVHPAQATPWYRRKSCMISSIIGAVLLLVAIGVGLAAVFFLKDKRKEDKDNHTTSAAPIIPTRVETSSAGVTSLTTVAPATHTVTLTRSASESEDPSTIIQKITASEPEDIGEILSSLLTRYPYYTTELTTEVRTVSNTIEQTLTREITLTQEPEAEPEPTTEVILTTQIVTISNTLEMTRTAEVTITEEGQPSEATEEVQISLVTLPKASVGSGTTVYEPTAVVVTATPSLMSTTTASSTSSATTATASTSKTTLSSGPAFSSKSTETSSSSSPTSTEKSSLSTRSRIAAVDVLRGPSSLQRRLIVWQDESDDLIARGSAEGNSTVYNINSQHEDLPKATRETSLTAAVDDEGAIHVFFLDDDSNVQHIAQSGAQDWKAYDSVTRISGPSSLAATWHENANNTGLLVLALYNSTGGGKTQEGLHGFFLWVSADRGESWHYEKPGVFNDANDDSDNGVYGLAIASGLAFDQDNDDEPEEGDVAGLHVILQSERGILAFECLFDGDRLEDCWENERQFLVWDAETNESEPISIESHPTHLSFSRKLSNSTGTPAKIYGLFRHSSGGGGLSEYRYVRDIEGESLRGTTELHESMEVSVIFWNSQDEPSVRAATSTDDGTLIVARGDGLSEIVYDVDGDDYHWDSVGLIDTSLSEDENGGQGLEVFEPGR